jgi:hypothetical protein
MGHVEVSVVYVTSGLTGVSINRVTGEGEASI